MTNNDRFRKEEDRLQREANRRVFWRVATFSGSNFIEFLLSCVTLTILVLFPLCLYMTFFYLFGA